MIDDKKANPIQLFYPEDRIVTYSIPFFYIEGKKARKLSYFDFKPMGRPYKAIDSAI